MAGLMAMLMGMPVVPIMIIVIMVVMGILK